MAVYMNKLAIYMAVNLRINNNHYLITCGGWCRLRSLLDEDKAAYCKCNAAIKLLIEVSKLRKEAPTTACDKIVIIINS